MSRTILPGWTQHIVRRHNVNRVTADTEIQTFFYDHDKAEFQAAMAELDVLREQIFTAMASPHRPIRPPAPGEVHRDAFLTAVEIGPGREHAGSLGLAADIGLINPWPWDWAKQQLSAWRADRQAAAAVAA